MNAAAGLKRLPKRERRAPAEIIGHYIVEKELAKRLKDADSEERKGLYKTVYDELYKRVACHPQITRKIDAKAQKLSICSKMKFLSGFLNQDSVFLEIGPGDCQLSFEAARYVKKVYAVDVSESITKNIQRPSNFELIISNGIDIPVHAGAVSIAYSNQLMEHVHPDDAKDMLQGIYNALAPGGVYICFTPHRFSGPHDISKYFDSIATGLHIKEYTNEELSRMFRSVGFSKIRPYVNLKIVYIWIPISLVIMLEKLLNLFSHGARKKIAGSLLFRGILGIRLTAKK